MSRAEAGHTRTGKTGVEVVAAALDEPRSEVRWAILNRLARHGAKVARAPS